MGKYLHGYTPKEQQRLIEQAEYLEPYIYPEINLEFRENLLEVGCGVGAQTKILARRFPNMHITGIDLSPKQLATAKSILSKEIKNSQVELHQQDAQKISLKGKFDSAFICWFLEHVPEPIKVLQGVYKHLQPGARVYCTEVFNQALFLEPFSPSVLKYWNEFNDYQWTIKGHPFIGASLGHLLHKAGFKDIQVKMLAMHFDSRHPKLRARYIDHFSDLILSAESALVEDGRVDKKLVENVKKELLRVKKANDSVYFQGFMRGTATR